MTDRSIFSFLHGYGGGPQRDRLEDYTTEVLAMLLQWNRPFLQAFLGKILSDAKPQPISLGNLDQRGIQIATQKHIETGPPDSRGRILDLYCRIGSDVVIAGEHKAWADVDMYTKDDEKGGEEEEEEVNVEVGAPFAGKMEDYSSWVNSQVTDSTQAVLYFLAPYTPDHYLRGRTEYLPGDPICITWTDVGNLLRKVAEKLTDPFSKGLLEQFRIYLEQEGLAMARVTSQTGGRLEIEMLRTFRMQLESVIKDLGYEEEEDSESAYKFVGVGHYLKRPGSEDDIKERWVGVEYQSPKQFIVWVSQRVWDALGDRRAELTEWEPHPQSGNFRSFGLDEGYFEQELEGQLAFLKDTLISAMEEIAGPVKVG